MHRTSRRLAFVLGVLLLSPLPAHAQFGKNKVQYQSFDFRVLETEHFDIYYYPEEEAAVHDAARMAERAYARLAKVFRHQWEERKPLVLYASQSDFQQTNIFRFELQEGIQGVTEGLRNRIVLFFPSAYPDFDHTLTHEIAHAFQYDIMRRSALSQGGNPFSFRPPLWFVEGMAEYLSTGEIDAQTAMWLRDASLSGYLTSLDRLSEVGDIRVYRFGQAIWYYIGTKYGDEKIGEIMQKAPLIGVREAIEETLGIGFDDLSDDWLQAVRLTYLPQVGVYPPARDVAVSLTSHVRDRATINIAPAVSPDGSRVAFISDRDYFNDVYVADLRNPERVDKILKGERTASFESMRFLRAGMSFSPDGRYLALSSKAGEQDALYIMRVRDEKIVSALHVGLEGIETPTWSPDGERLAFTGLAGGTSDLYVVDRDGSHLDRLTDDRFGQRDPAWSPDGGRIAFTTEFGPDADMELLAYSDYRIGILDLASGDVTYLPDQEGRNTNPQWGPDGGWLAYLSDRTGIPNVFLYHLREDVNYQLTDLLTGVSGITEGSPALSWSRDGSTMVFSAFSDAGWDLYRLDDPLALARTPYVPAEEPEYDLAARAFAPGGAPHPRPLASRAPRRRRPAGGSTPLHSGDDAIAAYFAGRASRRPAADAVRVPRFDEPVDVASLLRDPTIGLPRDTSGFAGRDYRIRFQPDLIAQPEVGFVSGMGAFGASQIAFSDLLGDHNLFASASVYGSLTDSDLFFTYANLKQRLNWGASAFQYRSDFAPTAVGGPDNVTYLYRSDVYRGAQAFASYPFSRFRRVEFGGVVAYVDRRIARLDVYDPTPEIEQDLSNQLFAAPSVAYVYDTALYGSTGPIGGSRQRLEVQRGVGDQAFTQLYGDLRRYWFLDRHLTLASRLLFLGIYGARDDNARFQSIGGPTLLRGYSYRDPAMRGTEVGLLNLELRFPIAERPRLGSSVFPPVRGAVWFDLGYARCATVCDGRAWMGEAAPPDTSGSEAEEPVADRGFRFGTRDDPGPFGFRLEDARASFGAGVRMNLFGFAVLRFDYAFPTDMASVDSGRFLFALAPEF